MKPYDVVRAIVDFQADNGFTILKDSTGTIVDIVKRHDGIFIVEFTKPFHIVTTTMESQLEVIWTDDQNKRP